MKFIKAAREKALLALAETLLNSSGKIVSQRTLAVSSNSDERGQLSLEVAFRREALGLDAEWGVGAVGIYLKELATEWCGVKRLTVPAEEVNGSLLIEHHIERLREVREQLVGIIRAYEGNEFIAEYEARTAGERAQNG